MAKNHWRSYKKSGVHSPHGEPAYDMGIAGGEWDDLNVWIDYQ